MKTVAFIDGAQFRPAALSGRLQLAAGKRFDWTLFRAALDEIAGGPVFDVHYFDSVQDAPGAGREAFHQFLRNSLCFQLHFTEMRERRRTCYACKHVWSEPEQQGVDVGISVQMLKLAFNQGYEQALLCSGDGALSSLAMELRDTFGKRVTIVGWHNSVGPSLRNAASRVAYLEEYSAQLVSDAPEPVGTPLSRAVTSLPIHAAHPMPTKSRASGSGVASSVATS